MQLATLVPLAVLLVLGLGIDAAIAQSLLPVPPDAPPVGAPPLIAPPVFDAPADAPPFELPFSTDNPEPGVLGSPGSGGLRPDEIAVLVEHPLAESFGLPGPMLEFSFSPGEGPPTVPDVLVPEGGVDHPPIPLPEPGLLGLLGVGLLGGLGLRKP